MLILLPEEESHKWHTTQYHWIRIHQIVLLGLVLAAVCSLVGQTRHAARMKHDCQLSRRQKNWLTDFFPLVSGNSTVYMCAHNTVCFPLPSHALGKMLVLQWLSSWTKRAFQSEEYGLRIRWNHRRICSQMWLRTKEMPLHTHRRVQQASLTCHRYLWRSL